MVLHGLNCMLLVLKCALILPILMNVINLERVGRRLINLISAGFSTVFFRKR